MADGQSETSLCRLQAGDQSYYLQTTLHAGGQDGVDLTLCDTHSAWQATGLIPLPHTAHQHSYLDKASGQVMGGS